MINEIIVSNMQKTINFAQTTNPIWPFASMLVSEEGRLLCLATDCAHISPLFHAEALALHALIGAGTFRGKMVLFSTAEPDALSQSALYWAKVTHDLDITHIYYGSSSKTINSLWKFGIDISAREIASRSHLCQIEFSEGVCENECDLLFMEAKKKQQGNHPARGNLSKDPKDFYRLHA